MATSIESKKVILANRFETLNHDSLRSKISVVIGGSRNESTNSWVLTEAIRTSEPRTLPYMET